MCPNLLTAIKNISDFKTNDLRNYFTTYAIRINAVGQQLEYYVKDAISGSFQSAKEQEDTDRYKGIFSYLGNQNNPPDLIIKNGDAFEVKKIQSFKASLALNNSPPKNHLPARILESRINVGRLIEENGPPRRFFMLLVGFKKEK